MNSPVEIDRPAPPFVDPQVQVGRPERVVPDVEKPDVLKAYLDRFKLTVQRYFPVPAGSPAEDLAPFAARYPVFELLP